MALLLSTRHAELSKINVQGDLVKVSEFFLQLSFFEWLGNSFPLILQSNAGITTRSKAKLTPERWTMIPLPGKVSVTFFHWPAKPFWNLSASAIYYSLSWHFFMKSWSQIFFFLYDCRSLHSYLMHWLRFKNKDWMMRMR